MRAMVAIPFVAFAVAGAAVRRSAACFSGRTEHIVTRSAVFARDGIS